jgi:hypothetical protein
MLTGKMYQVTKPFRWATRDYQPGDLIELRLRSHLRHPTLVGKVVPFGIDSTRAKAMKAEVASQASVAPTPAPHAQVQAKR